MVTQPYSLLPHAQNYLNSLINNITIHHGAAQLQCFFFFPWVTQPYFLLPHAQNYLNSLTNVTSIVVSHDSGFLDAICTHIIHYENRKLRIYRGNLSEFVRQKPEARSYYEVCDFWGTVSCCGVVCVDSTVSAPVVAELCAVACYGWRFRQSLALLTVALSLPFSWRASSEAPQKQFSFLFPGTVFIGAVGKCTLHCMHPRTKIKCIGLC